MTSPRKANPTNIEQANVETKTRTWSISDGDQVAVDADTIVFYAKRNSTTVTWTVDGAGGSINGVVDNDDGSGTWTIAAGDLDPGNWAWWALATVGTSVEIPDDYVEAAGVGQCGLYGVIHIIDRTVA